MSNFQSWDPRKDDFHDEKLSQYPRGPGQNYSRNNSGGQVVALYIKNVPADWNEDSLRNYLMKGGDVINVKILQPRGNYSSVVAIANIPSASIAHDIIEKLHRKEPLRMEISYARNQNNVTDSRNPPNMNGDLNGNSNVNSFVSNQLNRFRQRNSENSSQQQSKPDQPSNNSNIEQNTNAAQDVDECNSTATLKSVISNSVQNSSEKIVDSDTSFLVPQIPNSVEVVKKRPPCLLCRTISVKRCSVCKAGYCSEECQIAHWPEHQIICKPIPPLEDFPTESKITSTLERQYQTTTRTYTTFDNKKDLRRPNAESSVPAQNNLSGRTSTSIADKRSIDVLSRNSDSSQRAVTDKRSIDVLSRNSDTSQKAVADKRSIDVCDSSQKAVADKRSTDVLSRNSSSSQRSFTRIVRYENSAEPPKVDNRDKQTNKMGDLSKTKNTSNVSGVVAPSDGPIHLKAETNLKGKHTENAASGSSRRVYEDLTNSSKLTAESEKAPAVSAQALSSNSIDCAVKNIITCLDADKEYNCLITLKNDNCICAMVFIDVETAKKILQPGESFLSGQPLVVSKVKIGDFVVAQSIGDMEWYRAVVISVNEEKAEVCYIDYGNSEFVEKMKSISEEYKKIPGLSITASHHKADSASADDYEKYLELDTQIQFRVLRMKPESVLSKLVINSKDIASFILKSSAHTALKIAVAKLESVSISNSDNQVVINSSNSASDKLIHGLSNSKTDDKSLRNIRASESDNIILKAPQNPTPVKNDKNERSGPRDGVGSNNFVPRAPANPTPIKNPILNGPTKVNQEDKSSISNKNISEISSKTVNGFAEDSENSIEKSTASKISAMEMLKNKTAKSVFMTYEECQFLTLPVASKVEVMILYADHPTKIFLMPKSELKSFQDLDGIQQNMNGFCNSIPNTYYEPREGEILLAKFDEDNQWYRATCIQIDEFAKSALVLFVDFGNIEKVAFSKMVRMVDTFMDIPMLALHCCVKGFSPTDRLPISEDKIKLFKEAICPYSPHVVNVLAFNDTYYEIDLPHLKDLLQKLKN